MCSKISKSLFCINRIKNFVNGDSLKQLYYAMVHSHLSYCLNVYSCANTTALQKLRVKQKEALKVPKREIFLTEVIILSYPIWTGDLGTKAKNRFV
jgi:hypothetical protein